MVTLCLLLSGPGDDLWAYRGPGGRSIATAVAYLYPYLADKSKWPLKPDVQAWDGRPARQPSLLFAGKALGTKAYLELWQKPPADPVDPEVRRNIANTPYSLAPSATRAAPVTVTSGSGATWCALGGVAGYSFPNGASNLQAQFAAGSGAWSTINPTDSDSTVYTDYYLKPWFNHGVTPTNAKDA